MAVFAACVLSLLATPALADGFPAGSTWDWQLTEPVDLSRDVAVYDLHPELVTAEDIAGLKTRGIATICYVSVGTVEETSPDKNRFPDEVVGEIYSDWPDEKFLDIRRLDVLMPLMQARFETCKSLGFDAIEPDNMDVYDNESGFDLTEADALAYFTALEQAAHGLGLAIGQKNVPDLTARLVDTYDFIVTESCFQDEWCDEVAAYSDTGKAIFDSEYTDRPLDRAMACARAAYFGISMIFKDRDLTSQFQTCP